MTSLPGAEGLSVLVIDDEKNIRTTLSICLEDLGCKVTAVGSAEEALAALRGRSYGLAFLDLRLGASKGLDLLPSLLAINADLGVVIITAYATFDTAVEAIKRGAQDYLPKPFSPPQIRHIVEKFVERKQLSRKIVDLEDQLSESSPQVLQATESPKMRAIWDVLRRAAGSEAAVLLRGENGSGKGVLARALHVQSARAHGPFITVNCPTLSQDLLASELFGHVRGAFTGAVKDQAGRVESAEGGTLFLDEIGEINTVLQAKLLRFLQDKQFERIGENRTRQANVRLVAATNRNLDADVKDGRFREDLLYRLNVLEIHVPPLRERPEDILDLARQFLSFFARSANRPAPELTPAAEQVLLGYAWPGNIRELRNAMERAIILWPAQQIEPQAFPERIGGGASVGPYVGGEFSLEDVEREHILRILDRAPTLEDAAVILGIDASTLWRKRKRY